LIPPAASAAFSPPALEHLKANAGTVADREALQHNVEGWEYKPLPYLLCNTNLILHDINLPNIRFDDSLAKPLTEYREKDRVDVILTNPPFGGVFQTIMKTTFRKPFAPENRQTCF
jgi:type I restriction enzyme M protein